MAIEVIKPYHYSNVAIPSYIMKRKRKWDIRFLKLADHVAQWSKDPSTKTGAVIVDEHNRVISVGYNGFPRGISDYDYDYDDRENKLKLICHADRNALDNAPCEVRGMKLYITHPPCVECQKSIIQKGISSVIWWEPSPEFKERWGDGCELFIKQRDTVDEYYYINRSEDKGD